MKCISLCYCCILRSAFCPVHVRPENPSLIDVSHPFPMLTSSIPFAINRNLLALKYINKNRFIKMSIVAHKTYTIAHVFKKYPVCLFVCLYSEHFYHLSHLEDADAAAGVSALPIRDPNCLVLFSLAAEKRFTV